MTDSAPVSDRRDEIRAGEPFPESARPLLDANGNIVLETRGHPRVDALGRVLGPEAEPDLASAVVKAAKFDPRKLPPYTGTDPVAYVASLVGLTTVVKACDRADKATAAWADAEAQLRTARQELKQLNRSARTDQAIQLNAGKSMSITAATTKAHRGHAVAERGPRRSRAQRPRCGQAAGPRGRQARRHPGAAHLWPCARA